MTRPYAKVTKFGGHVPVNSIVGTVSWSLGPRQGRPKWDESLGSKSQEVDILGTNQKFTRDSWTGSRVWDTTRVLLRPTVRPKPHPGDGDPCTSPDTGSGMVRGYRHGSLRSGTFHTLSLGRPVLVRWSQVRVGRVGRDGETF